MDSDNEITEKFVSNILLEMGISVIYKICNHQIVKSLLFRNGRVTYKAEDDYKREGRIYCVSLQ